MDILPLARRPKAIDLSDKKNIISVYKPGPEFKRIQEAADKKPSGEDKGSGCMWGVSFLVFERKTARFLEYFCGSKTTRLEAGKMYDFLPRVVDGESLPPRALTLTSRVIDSGNFSWHGSNITECSTPISNLPPVEEVMKEIMSFLNPKVETVEKVDESVAASRRAR